MLHLQTNVCFCCRCSFEICINVHTPHITHAHTQSYTDTHYKLYTHTALTNSMTSPAFYLSALTLQVHTTWCYMVLQVHTMGLLSNQYGCTCTLAITHKQPPSPPTLPTKQPSPHDCPHPHFAPAMTPSMPRSLAMSIFTVPGSCCAASAVACSKDVETHAGSSKFHTLPFATRHCTTLRCQTSWARGAGRTRAAGDVACRWADLNFAAATSSFRPCYWHNRNREPIRPQYYPSRH